MKNKIINAKYSVFKDYGNIYIGRLTSDMIEVLENKIAENNMKHKTCNNYMWRIK
jgi:hypothetical protein